MTAQEQLLEIAQVYAALLGQSELTDEDFERARRRWREVVEPRYIQLLEAENEEAESGND